MIVHRATRLLNVTFNFRVRSTRIIFVTRGRYRVTMAPLFLPLPTYFVKFTENICKNILFECAIFFFFFITRYINSRNCSHRFSCVCLCVCMGGGTVSECVNPFPNKPWFLRVCSISLLKTLWEKEKLLVTSNFSFSHRPTVFSICLDNFLLLSSNSKLSSANSFSLEECKMCRLGMS